MVLITPPPIDEDGRFKYARYRLMLKKWHLKGGKVIFSAYNFETKSFCFYFAEDGMCNELI